MEVQLQEIHDNIKIKLKQKIQKYEKIRIVFYVIINSTFAAEPLFQAMLEDDMFEPFIAIIPDITRGREYMEETLVQSYRYFLAKYPKNVELGYNFQTRLEKSYLDCIDMACTVIPYEHLVAPVHRTSTALEKLIPTIYIGYGPGISNFYVDKFKSADFVYYWKFFVETKIGLELYKQASLIQGKNSVLMGFSKLDALATIPVETKRRKKIILAPHHTVQKELSFLSLSTFLDYYNFFLELPKFYPQIDFIFRPHPLLFVTLVNAGHWTKNDVQIYLDMIDAIENMNYQDGGAYFYDFINSDALIHDCGSFLAEYLLTKNPPCYLLKGTNTLDSLNLFGKECLKKHYLAESKEQILEFIETIVIAGKDTKKQERLEFVEKELSYNHPHVAKAMLDYLKTEILK